MNPWNLTPRELEAVQAFARAGNQKLVARQLSIESKTVATLIYRAREKMGVANNVLVALVFDRAVR